MLRLCARAWSVFGNHARLLNDAKFWNALLVTFLFVVGSAVIG